MKQFDAQLVVMEHEIAALKALRLADDPAVAQIAIQRELALTAEVESLKKTNLRQHELALSHAA